MIQKRDSRGMILFCVFNFVVALFGLAFGGVFSEPLEVKAAGEPLVYTLTYEQTLALFGTTLSGSWYNPNTGNRYPINFRYLCTSQDWIPYQNGGTDATYPLYVRGSNTFPANDRFTSTQVTLNSVRSEPGYLVYVAMYDTKYTEGRDWQGGTFVPSNSSNHTSLLMPFSVNLSGIKGIQSHFIYSCRSKSTAYTDSQYSFLQVGYSFAPQTKYYPLFNWYGNMRACAILNIPTYNIGDANIALDEQKIMYGACIALDTNMDGSSYDVNGMELNLCGIYPLDASGRNDLGYPGVGGYTSGSQALFILVQRPQLVDYVPMPSVTTASPIGGTETFPPQQTVNLSNLESGVQNIIIQGNNEEALLKTQISQLNTIIMQLNDIYAKMAESGDVPITLTPAALYPTLNSEIVSSINQDITTHTVAQLPDMGNGAQAFNTIGHELGLDTGIWLSLALFTVGFSIFCWVVFRGRG